jgi:hypothetical protein
MRNWSKTGFRLRAFDFVSYGTSGELIFGVLDRMLDIAGERLTRFCSLLIWAWRGIQSLFGQMFLRWSALFVLGEV